MIAAVNSTKTMASLPKGWRWVKLGEVVHRLSPATRRLKTHEYKEHGRIAVVDQGRDLIAGYTDDDQARTGVASPVIVFGDHTKVVKYVDFDFAIGADGVVLLDAVKGVDLRFLYYGLCQVRLPDMGYGRHYQFLGDQDIPLPPLAEQKRIAAILNEQMAAVERARKAAEEQAHAAELYPVALVRESLQKSRPRRMVLGECLEEVRTGIGPDWAKYPVLGATRQGLAPAKDPVGKTPERYKPVTCGTVFYNPMRILLGSIAMVDDSDTPGITSPDYVVVQGKEGVLDSRWFYYWFRSPFGAHLVESLSRGAVRERILFNRLAEGMIEIPSIDAQEEASAKMRDVAASRKTIAEQLDIINRLPAALLRRAFEGEL